MDVKPAKGVRVKVGATKEAVFGEEGVEIKKIAAPDVNSSGGVLTGRTLVGFCEVEMASLDGKKHWYPMQQVLGENGEVIKEEEIPIELPSDDSEEGEEGEEEE